MVEALCDSAVSITHEMIEASDARPEWRWITKQMIAAWNEGMNSLRGERSGVVVQEIERAVEGANFSPPDRPIRDRQVIGRSELLGSRRDVKAGSRRGK